MSCRHRGASSRRPSWSRGVDRESVACGKDAMAHIEVFRPYADAGFDEIYVANMGPQRQMVEFYREEILPAITQS